MSARPARHEMGPGGHCVCPRCGGRFPHRRGTHCQDERCPGCGAKMLREGSQHYQLWRAKQRKELSRGRRAGDHGGARGG